MLKSIKKIFGVNEQQSGSAIAPDKLVPPTPRSHLAPAAISHSVLSQVLVVTVLEQELNSATAPEVGYEIKSLYTRLTNVRHILLDLENIKYIDSAGLNSLVDLLTTVKQRRGSIGLAAATPHVEVLFKLTRLELVFTIRRNVIEAIDALERKG